MKKATVNEMHEIRMRVQACVRWKRRGRMVRRLEKGMVLFKDETGAYRKVKDLGVWKKRLVDKLVFFTWIAEHGAEVIDKLKMDDLGKGETQK